MLAVLRATQIWGGRYGALPGLRTALSVHSGQPKVPPTQPVAVVSPRTSQPAPSASTATPTDPGTPTDQAGAADPTSAPTTTKTHQSTNTGTGNGAGNGSGINSGNGNGSGSYDGQTGAPLMPGMGSAMPTLPNH